MTARTVLVALPLAAAAVLIAEGYLAARAEYLPIPEYVVDETVGGGSGRPLELRVLGDSTVAGVGAPDEASSLPVQLATRVAAALDRPVHVLGLGVSGARTADIAREQLPRLDGTAVDVLVIAIGSNDAIHATPVWVMDERTAAMLESARDVIGPAPVVLGGIPQFRTVPALLQPLRWIVGRYATLLRAQQRSAAAAAGVPFVDIAALASPRFVGVPESMSSDGFHPAPVGYGFWADALAPAVVAALDRADRTGTAR